MWSFLKQIFIDTAAVTVLFAFLFIALKETILKFLTGAIVSKFAIHLEQAKSELREKEQRLSQQFSSQEKELERISDHLSHLRRERDTALLNKKIEAAEKILKACTVLANLTMAVEILKVLNVSKISENLSSQEKIKIFTEISDLTKIRAHLEELTVVDRNVAKLYLSERSLTHFDVYALVVCHAAMTLTALSAGMSINDMFKKDALRGKVENLVPTSKEGFEKYGEVYAYQWVDWLFTETVKSLREDIHGTTQADYDFSSAADLAYTTKRAQLQAVQMLEEAGLSSDQFMK
jgi:hypothetical protein